MMNRLQFFVVVALIVMMGFGLAGLLELNKISERPEIKSAIVHGIETSWQSDIGSERIWSLTGDGDFNPWLDAHIAAVKRAQQLLPIKEK